MNRDRLKDMLIRHEGWKNRPYTCPAGHKTIGVGFNMEVNIMPSDIASHLRLKGYLPDDMINRLLDISIDTAVMNCKEIYKGFDDFSENRQLALIDFLFNVGAGTALRFKKMRQAIKEGDWNRAADEMIDSAWFKQVKGRATEVVDLVRRG
jgi:lysozyme